MAYYAALVSLMGLLEDIIHDQYPSLELERETVMKPLHEKLSFLEDSLKSYSPKGDEDSDHVEDLMKNAAEKVEDTILSMISKKIKSMEIQSRAPRWSTSDCGSMLKKTVKQIDWILQKLTTVKERQRNEKLQHEYDSAHNGAHEKEAPSGGGYSMVGFDKYQYTIKEQLCGQSSHLEVIPIVGTGGIGKTTLARNIFDDSVILDYFDYRAWITVSQNYHAKHVFYHLMVSLAMRSDKVKVSEYNENDDESVLKEKLYKFFKGRRFLVVIDDIWSTTVWDDLKRVFPDDGNGSRIILTTRLLEVAEYADTSGFVHDIQFLSEKDSWDLLRNTVFGQDYCPLRLEDIGRSIALKCHGLPLAIVVIAGILSKTRIQVEWEKIAMKMHRIFSKTDEQLSSILSLSYNHLPHQLKACFLHMGSFPEDYVIRVSNLICLWVAEGLLKPPNKYKSIEKFGEECLEDLVKRNLVLITKKSADGKFKLCVLHDLLRDFCRQKASTKYFFCSDREGGMFTLEKTRRLNFYGDKWYLKRAPSHRMKRLRSLMWFQKPNQMKFNEINWDRFEHLKILSAEDVARTNSIPKAILRMCHLKYLGFSFTFNVRFTLVLPPLVSALQNLQTLVIRHPGSGYSVLPPETWKLTKLRHIIIDSMILLPPALVDGETAGRKLECLQTLMWARDFTFTDEVINMIPNLRKLKTHYLASSSEWDTFNLNNLFQILQLEELNISFSHVHPSVSINSIAFTVNLKQLSLSCCGLPWECMMVVSSLPNLQVLRLRHESFRGDEWESMDGGFCHLKFLLLEELNLRCWRTESYHFPCLEHLKIRKCNNLVEIPQEIGDIPTLKYIDIYRNEHVEDSTNQTQEEQESQGDIPTRKSIDIYASTSVEESAIQIRKEQENQGNNMLQVRIGRR